MAQTSFIIALVCVALRSTNADPFCPSLCGEVPSDCGPCPSLGAILSMPPVFLSPVDGPIVPIPAPAPPLPVVISNKCTCQKTVLKPQLFQRLIQTQTNQRFLKKTYTPVVDRIAYKAKPRC